METSTCFSPTKEQQNETSSPPLKVTPRDLIGQNFDNLLRENGSFATQDSFPTFRSLVE